MLLMLLTTLRVGPVEGNCIKKKYVYLYIYIGYTVVLAMS